MSRDVRRPVSECLASVDSEEGRKRVAQYLNSLPFPHYESAPDQPGLLVRVDEDGTRSLGRFVDGAFQLVQ
jgi:hypothetical protein